MDAHKNLAYSTVLTAPSPANSGTSLTLAAGGGALLPAAPFNATVWPTSVIPLTTNAEIVRVTGIAGDVLTIVRAQESSSARSIQVGDQFAATITAKTLTDIETSFAGLNTAITGGSMTVNTSGISVNLPPYLTTAGLSQDSSKYAFTGFTTTTAPGSVVAGTHDTQGLKLAVPVYLTTAQPVGAYLTTARASNDAVGLNTAKTNATWTVNSSGISLDAGAYLTTAMASNAQTLSNIRLSCGTTSNLLSAMTFGDGGGVSFGLNGSVMTAQAPAGAPSPVNFSAGTTSQNLASVVFSNSNGVSFGLNGSTVTATVATNYQSQGAYLTTARASNDAVGLNTAKTNVTWTVNSSGLSLDAGGYAGTGFTTTTVAGAVVAGTHDTAGLKLAVPGYLTTAMASNRGSDFVAATAAFAGTNASGTIASNGISVSVNAAGGAQTAISGVVASDTTYTSGTVIWSGQNNITIGSSANGASQYVRLSVGPYITTARASNDAVGLNTALTANGVSWTVNSSGISLNVPAFLTTADLSQNSSNYAKNWKLTGNSAGTQSSAIGTDLWLAGGNGITLSGSSNSISFSVGSYLTTAMASNRGSDFVAATAAFAGTNASGTIASNGISVSVAAPGAAAENNWHNLLGANTAGNTTASGSTLGLSGLNMTLSGTNNSQIVLSVPATSSIVGTNGISIATNGSTISVSQVQFTKSRFNPFMEAVAVAGQHGQGSLHIHPIPDAPNFQFDRLALDMNWTNATNSTGSATISFWAGLYSRNASTLSSMASASASVGITFSGTGGNQSLQAGGRLFTIGWTTTITEGDIWMAIVSRTTSGNTDGSASQYVVSDINSNFSGVFGVASNASAQDVLGLGYYSASTSGIPASIAFSDIRGTASMALRAPLYRFLSQTA